MNAGADFTIPAGTPFSLSATGSDADGDTLFYNFEQFDVGAAQDVDPLDADNGSSPLFRSLEPAVAESSGTFTRVLPQLSDILSGTATKGEQIPSTTRSLNFRATARDQQGGTNGDDVLINVIDTGSIFGLTESEFLNDSNGRSQSGTYLGGRRHDGQRNWCQRRRDSFINRRWPDVPDIAGDNVQ